MSPYPKSGWELGMHTWGHMGCCSHAMRPMGFEDFPTLEDMLGWTDGLGFYESNDTSSFLPAPGHIKGAMKLYINLLNARYHANHSVACASNGLYTEGPL